HLVCAPGRTESDAHGCAPPNCNEGAACAPGFACDPMGSGQCEAVHCSEGGAAACPINQVCDATVSAGRGCLTKPCQTDADCDCGACIRTCSGEGCTSGTCQPRLWLCTFPVP
ncbi:MAG TPA: hypothetical protein VKZ49_11475, partial [Polyangiaceae bacterium]|nr:hypothetical protein [Polyangiaceae bacterium]